jgi:two-component sensor histidine kinase
MSNHTLRSGEAWLYVDEISHRALNDYTAMLAAVSRAARSVTEREGRNALSEVASLLRAGAAAHAALRPPTVNSKQRLDTELERVCHALSQSYLVPRAIEHTLCSEPVTMSARKCWRVCLVVAELVRNAARHAFVDTGGGRIKVDVRVAGGALQCMVSDDGRASETVVPGRGSAILDGLAGDLGGAIIRRYGPHGSTIALVFPIASEIAS